MKKSINKLETNLGFKISNFDIYIKAITHKSADKENNYGWRSCLGHSWRCPWQTEKEASSLGRGKISRRGGAE